MNPGSMLFFMIFMVPITAIVVRSPLGSAIARRIGGREADTERQLLAELEAMRGELDQVHEQLAEVHERLDWSERLLAAREPTPPEGVAR